MSVNPVALIVLGGSALAAFLVSPWFLLAWVLILAITVWYETG